MTRILVTGGAGFIGSNLCERLARDPANEVWSLDNYSTGSTDNHVAGVHYLRGNTSEIGDLVTFAPEIIYHLGEYSRVEQSFEDIDTVWRSNKDGTYAVLQFCRRVGAKLVYSGSSTKFGDGGLGRDQSPYAWTKATNTELVTNFGRWFNVPFAIVYFYNVYGRREIATGRYATLIAIFKDRSAKGLPLSVVAPGTQRRNFTHIEDIIDGLVTVGENGYGDEFGIGSSESFTILEIAQMFGGEITMLPERPGNRMTADVVTAKTEALGWRARHSSASYIASCRAGVVGGD